MADTADESYGDGFDDEEMYEERREKDFHNPSQNGDHPTKPVSIFDLDVKPPAGFRPRNPSSGPNNNAPRERMPGGSFRGPPPGARGFQGPPRGPPPQSFPQRGPPGVRGPPPRFQGPPPLQRPPIRGPPPRAGPPNVTGPPPNLTPIELWVETMSGDKVYYYHAKTRETSWTKPENVKIIKHEEYEAIVASGQDPVMAITAQEHAQGNVMPGNPTTDAGHGPPTNANVPDTAAGAPAASPSAQPGGFSMPPPNFSMPPPGLPNQGLNMPPPHMGFPANMPPPGMGMPPFGVIPPGFPPPGFGPPPIMKPPEVAEWSEHETPEGKKYYFNSRTQTSVWEKPDPLVKWDLAQATVSASFAAGGPPVIQAAEEIPAFKPKETPSEPVKAEIISEEDARLDHQLNQLNAAHAAAGNKVDIMKPDSDQEIIVKKEVEKPKDKSKPVSSTPVPGSPWCVVWTGDSKQFFYNPSKRLSVWEMPDDLKGREDVLKLIVGPPGEEDEAEKQSLKRPAEDEPQSNNKKQKTKNDKDSTSSLLEMKKVEVGKDAAIEAEVKAARERAVVPVEIRMKQFRDMLAEKEVSAFSTWEKELHKIVFDPRYLLLTSKERKQVFDQYVKERAEEERQERRKELKKKRDAFIEMLSTSNINSKMSFSEIAAKFAKEERFKAIDKMRERETIYNEFLTELRKKEKEERNVQKEKVKVDYIAMLKEMKELNRNSSWTKTKDKIASDSRYKAVDSSAKREDWFRDYIKILDAGSASDDEERSRKEREREKKERQEASLREREKEVQKALGETLRERDKERELHKKEEASQQFKALLVDLVRNIDGTWRETRKLLKKDARWDLCGLIERDDKEKLFDEHIESLTKRNKEMFHSLLDSRKEITLTSTWKEVKKLIKDDPKYNKFSSSDRKREREFEDYIREKYVQAKADFRELLKQTKLIDHTSKKRLADNSDYKRDIEKLLENDKRYLVLDCVSEEREKILLTHLEELEKKGPPPPPTASEPNRRK